MPIPKPVEKKHAPPSAGRHKKDYARLIGRARERKAARVAVRERRLLRLLRRHGGEPLTTQRRRAIRAKTVRRPAAVAAPTV